jgi:hypothetical protein
MDNIVQQNGYLRCKNFFISNYGSFPFQLALSHAHEVVSAKAMVQPGIYRARVHELRHSHLIDAAETLIPRVADNLHHKRMLQPNETVKGVVYYFSFESHGEQR